MKTNIYKYSCKVEIPKEQPSIKLQIEKKVVFLILNRFSQFPVLFAPKIPQLRNSTDSTIMGLFSCDVTSFLLFFIEIKQFKDQNTTNL